MPKQTRASVPQAPAWSLAIPGHEHAHHHEDESRHGHGGNHEIRLGKLCKAEGPHLRLAPFHIPVQRTGRRGGGESGISGGDEGLPQPDPSPCDRVVAGPHSARGVAVTMLAAPGTLRRDKEIRTRREVLQ
jgi:hypothetical protein